MPHLSFKTLGKIAVELFKAGDKKTLHYLTKNKNYVLKPRSSSYTRPQQQTQPITRRAKSVSVDSSKCKEIFDSIQQHLSLPQEQEPNVSPFQPQQPPLDPIQEIQKQFSQITIDLKELLNQILSQPPKFKTDLAHLIDIINTANSSLLVESPCFDPNQIYQTPLSELRKLKLEVPKKLLKRASIGYAGICTIKAPNFAEDLDPHSYSKQFTINDCLFYYEQLTKTGLINDLLEMVPQYELISDFKQRYQ